MFKMLKNVVKLKEIIIKIFLIILRHIKYIL